MTIHKLPKRLGALLLSSTICLQIICGCASAAEKDTVQELDAANIITDISQYENLEVFILYQDGTSKVLSYDSKTALADALQTLSEDDTIALIQPNYSYTDTGLSVNDTLAGEQWALSNDGTFEMEEEQNEFPVFDDPFGMPSLPWQWHDPFPRNGLNSGIHHRFSTTSAATASTAVSGIDINAQTAWDVYDGGTRDTVVAIIDTGIDYTNPELSGSMWVNQSEIPNNGIDDDGNGYVDDVYGWNFYNNSNQVYVGDEDDHGTHCAGTIAAASNNETGIAGIVNSSHVKLMSVKALGGSDGSGTTESLIKAIQYAEANGASIVNLSLGSSYNDQALYQTIANSNMLFVIAAGNGDDTSNAGVDIDASPIYPAAYNLDNIITVANLNYDGNLHYSSNYGASSVDIAAPGSYILSTTTDNTYSYMTGTSMAAPMVTAAAAMLYSYYDTLSLAQIKQLILSSAKSLDSLQGVVAAGGMLDLGAAMTYDTTSLPDTQWNNSTIANQTVTTPLSSSAQTTGSAPSILATMITQNGQSVLKVTVTDADNDISRTAYASGAYPASSFTNGSGTDFILNEDGYALFSVSHSGTYTFYAADAQGHETAMTIQVSSSRSPFPSWFPW